MTNVTNERMSLLYSECSAVLLASLTEGLGLPVLEAVEYNKPVACSDIPVFKEISNSFNFFNPLDPYDIATTINGAVKQRFSNKLKSEYTRVNKQYSWKNSASAFLIALNKFRKHSKIKKNLLIECPSPSRKNGVNRFIEKYYAGL